MYFRKILDRVRDRKISSIKIINKVIYLVDKSGLFSEINLSKGKLEFFDLLRVEEKILDFDVYENNTLYILTDRSLYSIDLDRGERVYEVSLKNYFKVYKPKFSKFEGVLALGNHVSAVNDSGIRELFGLKERYFDIVGEDMYKRGELSVLLRGLWGFTIFDLYGHQISHRTFGDVIVDAKLCMDSNSGKIFVGSKNGGFYIFNAVKEEMYNLDLGKSLYTFDIVSLRNSCLSYVLIWCSYDGMINYMEGKGGEVVEKVEITKLNEPCGKLIALKIDDGVYLVNVQGEKIEIWKMKMVK